MTQPPDQGSTPRLVALIACHEIQSPEGSSGPKNLIGVHDRITVEREEFGGRFEFFVYAAYAGPFGPHQLRLRVVDMNTHAPVADYVADGSDVEDAVSYFYEFPVALVPRAAGNFELHLLIDGVDAGFLVYTVREAP